MICGKAVDRRSVPGRRAHGRGAVRRRARRGDGAARDRPRGRRERRPRAALRGAGRDRRLRARVGLRAAGRAGCCTPNALRAPPPVLSNFDSGPRMSDGLIADRRLSVIVVLVASMVLTLIGRLYYVQVLDKHKPVQTAGQLHDGADRRAGTARADRRLDRPSRSSTTPRSQVITVNNQTLQGLTDHGARELAALAKLLEIGPRRSWPRRSRRARRPCRPRAGRASRTSRCRSRPTRRSAWCWRSASTASSSPASRSTTQTLPHYPDGSLAAHVLGYTAAVTAADKKANKTLDRRRHDRRERARGAVRQRAARRRRQGLRPAGPAGPGRRAAARRCRPCRATRW